MKYTVDLWGTKEHFAWWKLLLKIAFLRPTYDYELSSDLPMSYRQLKAYLLAFAMQRDSLNMFYCESAEDIPSDVDVVCVSAVTHQYQKAIELGALVRSRFPSCLLLLGGHHISSMPQTLPHDYDAGVLYEGEKTLTEIIDRMISTGREKNWLSAIRGIVYYDSRNRLIANPPNDSIEPLDEIPFPVMEGTDPPYIFSSRGCPYNCSFCASTTFWKKVRYFSAEYVIAQIESTLQKYPEMQQVVFWDDLVVANRTRFAKIVDEVEARGINKRVSFGFAVRANLVDEQLCQELVRLNTSFISFGAESGNNRVLHMLKGRNVSVEVNQKAIDLLSYYGLVTSCSFIIGAPSETRTELEETFAFIRSNTASGKLSRYVVNVLMPLPGTQMWRYACDNKIVEEPINWNRFNYYASYKDSQVKNIYEWIEKRLECDSYYLNNDSILHREMLDILADFEQEMGCS